MKQTDAATRLDNDPVGFVHSARGAANKEVVGLIAALLAFGNVVAIRASIARVLAALGPSPARAIARLTPAQLDQRLEGFVHRVYRGPHLAALLANAASVRKREGSLGASFARSLREADLRCADRDDAFVEALADFADALRGPDAPRGLRHLVPDPRAGSAVKRLLLYLRWMIRPRDGVDFGLWPVPADRLLIPVDTHVHRIGRNLGLTQRTDASLRTAREITSALRRFDPCDPVRYDFAICHLGVSRECPSRRDPARCERCVLRQVCVHWQPAARGAR